MVRYRPSLMPSLILAIAAAARYDGQQGLLGLLGGPGHDPVDRLVDSAVSAEHDDQLTACRGGQLASVAAVPGMFYVKVDQPGERTDRQIRGAPRRGGRLRVNDQEASHSLRLASA